MLSLVISRQFTRLLWLARIFVGGGYQNFSGFGFSVFVFFSRYLAFISTVIFYGILDVVVEVIVVSEQQSVVAREGNRGDVIDDVVVGIYKEFLVGSQVKEAVGGVVRIRGEGIVIGEELQDVGSEWDEGTAQGYGL